MAGYWTLDRQGLDVCWVAVWCALCRRALEALVGGLVGD